MECSSSFNSCFIYRLVLYSITKYFMIQKYCRKRMFSISLENRYWNWILFCSFYDYLKWVLQCISCCLVMIMVLKVITMFPIEMSIYNVWLYFKVWNVKKYLYMSSISIGMVVSCLLDTECLYSFREVQIEH